MLLIMWEDVRRHRGNFITNKRDTLMILRLGWPCHTSFPALHVAGRVHSAVCLQWKDVLFSSIVRCHRIYKGLPVGVCARFCCLLIDNYVYWNYIRGYFYRSVKGHSLCAEIVAAVPADWQVVLITFLPTDIRCEQGLFIYTGHVTNT